MRIREIDNYKNYDNPTDAELDAERERADRETARMLTNRTPQSNKLADKIRQGLLSKFAKRHGDIKASQMLYSLEQRDPDYFIKKANMEIYGIK